MLRFKEFRGQHNLRVKDIHQETGIGINTLWAYNKGAKMSATHAEIIGEKYNINPAWFLGWSDDQSGDLHTIEKIVYVEKDIGRLPSYYQPDVDGNLIRWKQRKTY